MSTAITSADELDALPVGSVIRDGWGALGEREDDGWSFACGRAVPSSGVQLPATVLHRPDRPAVTVSEEDREALEDEATEVVQEWLDRMSAPGSDYGARDIAEPVVALVLASRPQAAPSVNRTEWGIRWNHLPGVVDAVRPDDEEWTRQYAAKAGAHLMRREISEWSDAD